jgi:hypothetical protein
VHLGGGNLRNVGHSSLQLRMGPRHNRHIGTILPHGDAYACTQ